MIFTARANIGFNKTSQKNNNYFFYFCFCFTLSYSHAKRDFDLKQHIYYFNFLSRTLSYKTALEAHFMNRLIEKSWTYNLLYCKYQMLYWVKYIIVDLMGSFLAQISTTRLIDAWTPVCAAIPISKSLLYESWRPSDFSFQNTLVFQMGITWCLFTFRK